MQRHHKLILAIVPIVCMLLVPMGANAATYEDSTYLDKSGIHYEATLYSDGDNDPDIDTYVVVFHIRDDLYGANPWVVIKSIQVSITARQWGSPNNAPVVKTSDRSPDPGWIWSPFSASVAGIGVSVPAGIVSCYEDGYERQGIPYARYTWTINQWVYPVFYESADFAIAFEVEEGMGIYVSCRLLELTWAKPTYPTTYSHPSLYGTCVVQDT